MNNEFRQNQDDGERGDDVGKKKGGGHVFLAQQRFPVSVILKHCDGDGFETCIILTQ